MVLGKPLNNTRLRAFNTLLIVYMSTNDWPNALSTAQYIKENIAKNSNLKVTTLEQTELGIIVFYNHIGEYELAKQLAKKLIQNVQSKRVKCTARAEFLYSHVKTTPENIKPKDFYQTHKFCLEVKNLTLENVVHGFLAEYFLTTNQPAKAIEVLTSNIFDVKSTNYQALIAGFYELMAEAYLAIQDFANAEQYAQMLIDTEEEHQYKQTITTAYKVLAGVTEHKKDFVQAFYYYKKYSEAKQLNLDQDNAKLLAIQKAEFDAVEKNARIALLDKENTLLKTQALLDNESAQNRRLALALLTMALVVFILWAYKNRRIYLKMRYFAETDELTGISNRHHFAQLAHSAIKLCRKTNQPVSFVIFDLDFFKKINDSYGHLTGDEALKMAVNAAKFACRKNDIIGRLGGEEFGILLPGCGNHLAAHIAEKCRRAIEKVDTSASGHQFTLTASFGVSDSSTCDYEFTKLFAGADRALYQSKDLGRNQVFSYQANAFTFNI